MQWSVHLGTLVPSDVHEAVIRKVWTETLQLPKIFSIFRTVANNECGVILIENWTTLSRANIFLKDYSLQYMVSST
jgi:hypothetical protein